MLAGLKISLNLRVSFGCLKDSLVSLSAMVMDIINPMLSNPVMLNSFSKPANKSPKTTSEMRNSRCHGIRRQVGIPLFHKCQIKTEKSKKESKEEMDRYPAPSKIKYTHLYTHTADMPRNI